MVPLIIVSNGILIKTGMKLRPLVSVISTLLIDYKLLSLASAHTWVEQLNRIAPNGTMLSPPGFPPKWFGRGKGFHDDLFTNLLGEATYSLCAKQPLGHQVDGFPVLEAAPGDVVGLRYQENGHVTLPDTPAHKPANRGTVYVYGTSSPHADDSLFDVYKKWTADGTGGDGRGKLLATRHYDDGQCYQVNDGPISKQRQDRFRKSAAEPQGADLWCQADIRLPGDLPTETFYSIYFIWTWPTLQPEKVAGTSSGDYGDFPEIGSPAEASYLVSPDVTKSEIYSSCAMVHLTGENMLAHSNEKSFIQEQDINFRGIKEQIDSSFLV